jgi:hypothetical protein
MHPDLAKHAGIDLDDAEPIGEFALEGETCTGLRKNVTCLIVDGHGDEIELPSIPVIFVEPWTVKREFASVLGTLGMGHIRVTVCARGQWIEISQESS